MIELTEHQTEDPRRKRRGSGTRIEPFTDGGRLLPEDLKGDISERGKRSNGGHRDLELHSRV